MINVSPDSTDRPKRQLWTFSNRAVEQKIVPRVSRKMHDALL